MPGSFRLGRPENLPGNVPNRPFADRERLVLGDPDSGDLTGGQRRAGQQHNRQNTEKTTHETPLYGQAGLRDSRMTKAGLQAASLGVPGGCRPTTTARRRALRRSVIDEAVRRP